LNNSAANATAFALPTLDGVSQTLTTPSYLLSRTPGSPNSGPKTNVGPFISNVTQDPLRPPGNPPTPPLVITANVTPSLRPLATSNPVQLRYRVMYLVETV